MDQEIDCEGNVLMPGFKDAHTHSAMVAMRSFADDMPLQEWLNTKIFPLEAKMTDQDNYDLTQLAILEYVSGGVTSIFDMYLSPKDIAQACVDMGMRCVLVSGLNKFGPALEVMEERYLSLNQMHPLITYMMGVHAEYTCSKELLEQVSALIHKYQAPLFAHMSETKLETDECVERYGMTPPAFFDSLGLFDFGGGGYHCVYFTEEDMDLFAKKGLYAVTNPGSNTKLASGIAPITRFLEKGICVGIGTDGASSNNCLDMFREMFLTTGLAKLRDQDASAVAPEEVLKMATTNGGKGHGPYGLRRAGGRKEGGSHHDRPASAQHAAVKQHREEHRIQRKQDECKADHDRRKNPLPGRKISVLRRSGEAVREGK